MEYKKLTKERLDQILKEIVEKTRPESMIEIIPLNKIAEQEIEAALTKKLKWKKTN